MVRPCVAKMPFWNALMMRRNGYCQENNFSNFVWPLPFIIGLVCCDLYAALPTCHRYRSQFNGRIEEPGPGGRRRRTQNSKRSLNADVMLTQIQISSPASPSYTWLSNSTLFNAPASKIWSGSATTTSVSWSPRESWRLSLMSASEQVHQSLSGPLVSNLTWFVTSSPCQNGNFVWQWLIFSK